MKQILLLLFTSLTAFSFSQDTLSALFIGNSYTHQHNVPNMVASIANNLGDHLDQTMQTAGGATFESHALNAATYNMIGTNNWDYVVLQAQSQEPSFPDNQVNTNTLPYAIQLADSVYANNFCSEVLFFMTWGRENGDPQWQPISTFEGMQSRLRNAYMRFADSVQGSVSPVGMAWKYVRDNHPSIQLYAADGSHASTEGAYLTACTFYSALFRKPVTGATFYNGVDPIVAGQLQAAADFVVLDSLDHWNLRDLSNHTMAEFDFTIGSGGEVTFTNKSIKAQSFAWDFGDGQLSTDENPEVTYTSNGTYTVTLTAQSECNNDVVSYDVTINTLGIDETEAQLVKLKSLGDHLYAVSSDSPILSIEFIDASGSRIEFSDNQIDLSNAAAGIYFLNVKTEAGEKVIKVVR